MDFSNLSRETSKPILDLKKTEVLDLSKTGSSLKHLILGAGWDVPKTGQSYDLDIAAFLVQENGRIGDPKTSVIYFKQKAQDGIYLDKDNRTGAGDGDDERIFINTEKLKPEVVKLVFVVTIFNAAAKGQVFGKVKNAYVRLLDQDDNERVLCQFPLTTDASTDTAIIFCELNKNANGWDFKAIGEGCQGDLNDLVIKYM